VTLEIRLAGPADLDAILAIERSSFPVPWTREVLLPELQEDERHQPVLALLQGEPVGFALIWVIADERHLVNFAVDPDHRRKGIGRRMLAGIIDRAREEGANLVTLEVRSTNDAARELYLDFGFIDVALRPRYYPDTREDAVIMLLELSSPGSPS
jgi:ribosomal-protein-alanine N-acetyltransferase